MRPSQSVRLGSANTEEQTQNLRRLKVEHFERRIPVELQQKLAPVLCSLTSIELIDTSAAFAFKMMRSVRTLRVVQSWVRVDEEHEAPTSGCDSVDSNLYFPDLEYLQIRYARHNDGENKLGDCFDIFSQLNHHKLVGVDLAYSGVRDFDANVDLRPLASALSQLTSLQSLVVDTGGQEQWSQPVDVALSGAFTGLSQLVLRHLQISIWPTPTLLPLLPHTLESLIIAFDNDIRLEQLSPSVLVPLPPLTDPDADTMVQRLEAALQRQDRYVPALAVLGIELGQIEEKDAGDRTAKARCTEVMGRAEGFELRWYRDWRDAESYPGRWLN